MASSRERDPDEPDRPVVEPSSLGQFVALDGCPQFHTFEYDRTVARERRQQKDWKEAFEPLSLLLAKDGHDFEARVVAELEARAYGLVSHDHVTEWETSKTVLRNACENAAALSPGSGPLLVTQARFGMEIGAWPIAGDADIVALWPTDEGLRIRVLDVKAAHEEKSFHRIQVAVYTRLFRQFLETWNPAFSWTLEGGIIHRGTALDAVHPSALPSFPLEQPEADVRRLLQPGGQFDHLWTADREDLRYQLAPKCYSCAYKEACFTEAIEEDTVALLGLSRGEQERLADHGIETLHDLAGLAYPPSDPRPYEYEELTATDRDRYQALLNEPGIGERLPEYIQQAQALLGELDPGSMYTPNTDRRAPWLLGSGNGDLPADDPPFEADIDVERGTLVRTYLHVEVDRRRDRLVMLNGYVTASHPDATPRTVSALADSVPDERAAAARAEATVLTDFFSELFDAIRGVAADMGRTDAAPLHLYFYTAGEREAVVEASRRHPDDDVATAVRDLLGLRGAIASETHDQAMVSIVRSEVENRIALPVPNPGLLPVTDYFQPSEDFFARTEWTYTRSDGTTIDLREAFNHKLFDYFVPYARTDTGIELYPQGDHAGFYPSRARQGSHIPLEYVWAALGKLTPDWVADISEEYQQAASIAPFRWVDREDRTTRITSEDLTALGTRLARCLAHVERGLEYRNTNLPKRALPLDRLESFTLGDASFPRACREYLQLEYTAGRSEVLAHYRLPVQQRVRRGESIPIVVTDAAVDDRGTLQVEGRLLYDQMFEDGDRVAGACRQKGSEGATGGSWMVANRITRQGEPAESANPFHVERGPGVTVEELDIEAREIRLSAIPQYRTRDREFVRRHRGWTVDRTEADANTVYFGERELFVLDPRSDDLTAQRAYTLLEAAGNNYVCQLLDELATGQSTSPSVGGIDADGVHEFLSWATEAGEPPPNEAQQAFVRDTSSQCVMLQGPPGTGKTAGALGVATLARAYARARNGEGFAGLVTAESNTAVDELLEAVVEYYRSYQEAATTAGELDEVQIVRLTGAPPTDPHPDVEYVNYHRDRDRVAALVAAVRARNTDADDSSATAAGDQQVLVFATPSRLYGLVNKFDIDLDESRSPLDWLRQDATFFDVLVVDEASMMRVPSFTLAGAFVREDAQLLVGGDQRQLPPVRQHEWAAEDRRTVTTYAPFLSTLDYLRALTGSTVRDLPEESILAGTADCPMYRLERSYRCHVRLAEFLQTHVYAADAIDYWSGETATLRPPSPSTPGVDRILDPAAPITLVVHDDQDSQQSNPVEAAIGAAVVDAVDPADSTGIVTPHNAQRGLLSTLCSAETEIDTVERYQGGERDCILVSATASDPDFLAAEREFILNPNRLNVAVSRMKRKVIIVASETVFDLIPPDVELYGRAGLWKAVYRELGVLDRDPGWTGTLGELVGDPPGAVAAERDTSIAVYPIRRE